MVATSPLLSGQEIRRMAEFFMVAVRQWRRQDVASRVSTEVAVEALGATSLHAALLLQFLENFPRRVRSRSASQSHPRMRTAPTQIQILDGRAVSGPVEQRTHGKELIERQVTVKNLPARQSVLFFQVQRRDDLVRQNQLRQIRRVLRQCLHHGLPKFSA